MISTDDPNCASDIAVFTAVVVLPSPGSPLVISIVLGGASPQESSTDVLTVL
jgi:hypothetical protein